MVVVSEFADQDVMGDQVENLGGKTVKIHGAVDDVAMDERRALRWTTCLPRCCCWEESYKSAMGDLMQDERVVGL